MVPFWEERGLRPGLPSGVCVRSVGNDKGGEGRCRYTVNPKVVVCSAIGVGGVECVFAKR
jgi:hypothetical protein